MANEKVRRLTNGQWELILNDENGVVFAAATKEEAERMAAAYLKGDTAVKKSVVRKDVEKKKKGLLQGES